MRGPAFEAIEDAIDMEAAMVPVVLSTVFPARLVVAVDVGPDIFFKRAYLFEMIKKWLSQHHCTKNERTNETNIE